MRDEKAYPAPALARGIRILEALNGADGPLTLEDLARRVGYPKASLLRLLETLTTLGLVRRDEAGKTYSALAGISHHDRKSFVRGVVRKEMERLTSSTNITSEWYEPRRTCMELLDLLDPPQAAVHIAARVGFRRPFDDELEAVTRIALGALSIDCSTVEHWQYALTGDKVAVIPANRDAQIAEARQNRACMDVNWNANGIRRYSAAVMDGSRLIGILALTETFTPGADKRIESNLKQLTQSANTIAAKITSPSTPDPRHSRI